MTQTLFEAVNATGVTNNGAVTNESSLNRNVDFFFLAGASRGKDISNVFAAALGEDSEVAVRILQYARDARGGAGERDTFRTLFAYLIKTEPGLASRVMSKTPDLGRWDDLFVAFGTPLERDALRMIASALQTDNNGLCAKWMPRQGPIAGKIRAYMKMTPKDYRQLLVMLSNTVEQKMCAKEWDKINYSHVPSVAAGRYQKAFLKRDATRYAEYKEQLTTGEAKVNAAVSYPYDVIRSLKNGDQVVSTAQWNALPNYLEGSNENILSVVDVSGSMSGVAVSGSVTAMDVAISLGLYLSERMGGAFKDQFVTFSSKPKLQKVSGDLVHRYNQMQTSDWGMSTDISAVFKLILAAGVKHSVPESEMPTKVLLLSDMEFDRCVSGGSDVSAMGFIEREFNAAGYKCPGIVFWNLNGRAGNTPVTYNKTGTALVSGFSPSIVKSVLGGDEMTPIGIVLKTVMVAKYDF